MSTRIIKNSNEVENYLQTVIEETNKHTDSLGFLGYSVYQESCYKENLWILAEGNTYVGHIMFNITYRDSKITVLQTFIREEFRKQGYAKILIDELKKYGEDRNFIHIKANVASDLVDSNIFYGKMGFDALYQKDGGKTKKRKINVRSFNINTPSLLSLLDSSNNKTVLFTPTPVNNGHKYVLDLNILIDVSQNRENKQFADLIFRQAFSGNIQVFISSETKIEIQRTSSPFENDGLLNFINALPTLPEALEIDRSKLFPEIQGLIFGDINKMSKSFNHKVSDINHIIHSICNRCTAFITRDNQILKSANSIYNKYKLEIISPTEFLDDIEIISDINNITLNDKESELTIKPYDKSEQEISTILDSIGIKNIKATNLLQGDIAYQNNIPYAISMIPKLYRKTKNLLAYIFYRESFENFDVIDHMLENIYRFVKKEDISSLTVITRNTDNIIKNILINKGYSIKEDNDILQYTRFITESIISKKNWSNFCKHINSYTPKNIESELPNYDVLLTNGILIDNKFQNFFNFETFISPTLFVPKGRRAVVIPIKPSYAEELTGIRNKKQLQLFQFNKKIAFLKTEKAYFKKPNSGCKINKGDLLMFYVSKPESAVIGVARITMSDNLSIEEIDTKVKNQGVLDTEILESLSRDNKVHTITFDNFIPFKNNVKLNELKKLGLGKANFVTTEETSDNTFLQVCKLGGVYEE